MSEIVESEQKSLNGVNVFALCREIVDFKRKDPAITLAHKAQYDAQLASLKPYFKKINTKIEGFYPGAYEFDSPESAGLVTEALFLGLVRAVDTGSNIRIGNYNEDRRGIDFVVTNEGKEWFVDVTSSPHEQGIDAKFTRGHRVIVVVPHRRGNYVTADFGKFQKIFNDFAYKGLDESNARKHMSNIASFNLDVLREQHARNNLSEEEYRVGFDFFKLLNNKYGEAR